MIVFCHLWAPSDIVLDCLIEGTDIVLYLQVTTYKTTRTRQELLPRGMYYSNEQLLIFISSFNTYRPGYARGREGDWTELGRDDCNPYCMYQLTMRSALVLKSSHGSTPCPGS